MISLRDYQLDLHNRVRVSMESGKRAPLVVAPCGAGKTVIFCDYAHRVAAKGKRTLILSHRDELVEQISDTLNKFELPHSFIAAGRVYDPRSLVQVASVMSLARRLENQANPFKPDLIIIDEAHHGVAGSWKKILGHYARVRRIGVTATAQRTGGEPLGDVFDDLIVGPTAGDLIGQGVLSPYIVVAPPLDLGSLPHRGGDFDKAELAQRLKKSTITGDAVANYSKYASGKRAVVFCVSIEYCIGVCAEFTRAGYRAAVIDGTMDRSNRKQQVQMFRDGHLDLLVTCDLISEGFDLPAIEAAIMLRPTDSLTLWIQQFGRALRMYEGKGPAIILDHAGNTERHGWLPETEVEWSLDGKAKFKKGDSGPAVRRCPNPKCFKADMTTATVCKYCGTPYGVGAGGGREVEHEDGELVPMTQEQLDRIARGRRVEQGRAESLEDLIELGRKRGLKDPVGWAGHVFRAREAKRSKETANSEEALI